MDSSKVNNQSDSLILLIRHIAAAQQNQQSGLCAQPILPSAWASAPSDQSLPSTWVLIAIANSGCPGCTESLLGACHFVDFVMGQLIYPLLYTVLLSLIKTCLYNILSRTIKGLSYEPSIGNL